MRNIFHPLKRNQAPAETSPVPAVGGLPSGDGLPSGEPEIGAGSAMPDQAGGLPAISSIALEQAGAVVNRLGPPPDRPTESTSQPKRVQGQGDEEKMYVPGTAAPDFMKHMLGNGADSRVRRIMTERKKQQAKGFRPRVRRATT